MSKYEQLLKIMDIMVKVSGKDRCVYQADDNEIMFFARGGEEEQKGALDFLGAYIDTETGHWCVRV